MRKAIQNDIKYHELKEPEFRDYIQTRWNCDLNKLAIVYGFDYAIVKNGELKGFIELKRRLFESYKYKDSISIKRTYLLTSLVICMLIYNMPLCMTLYWATNSTFSFLGNFKS